MDGGCGRDPGQASTQAEDGSPGRSAHAESAPGRPFSTDLGGGLGESRSAATVVAPTADGADAHSDHEPTAGDGHQRRLTLQEEVVARTWTPATGSVPTGPVGKPAPTRSAGVVGPTEPNHRGTKPGGRTRS